MNTIGSAVYIDTGINDYYDNDDNDAGNKTTNNIIGGQVCINPIFSIPNNPITTTTTTPTSATASIPNTITSNNDNDTTASTIRTVKSKSMIHSNNSNDSRSRNTNTVQRHPTNRRAVVVRKRQQQQRTDADVPISLPSSTTTTAVNNNNNNNNVDSNKEATSNATTNSTTTSATMSDCLACSGCITTTETIFLQEQYNVQKLQRDILLLSSSNLTTIRSPLNNSNITTPTTSLSGQAKNHHRRRPFIVVSISSASMADLCRYLLLEPSSNTSNNTTTAKNDTDHDRNSDSSKQEYYRVLQQLTIAMYRYCHVQVVLDATITTHLTKQLALYEFIMQYRNSTNCNNNRNSNDNNNSSSSSSSSQQLDPELQQQHHQHNGTNTDDNKNHMNISNETGASLDKTSCSSSTSTSDEMTQHRRKEQMYEQLLYPSIAVSAYETQYWIPPPPTNSSTNENATATIPRTEIVNRSTCTIRQSSSSPSGQKQQQNHGNEYQQQQEQQQQQMPIISSSCPAIICLIEKSYPQFVPHLSTVVSPMIAVSNLFLSATATNWMMTTTTTTTSYNDASSNNNMNSMVAPNGEKDDHHTDNGYNDKDVREEDDDFNEYYHLSIMPCHDKKLEASRNDFKYPSKSGSIAMNKKTNSLRPAVDMVITTMELIQLLHDAIIVHKNQKYHEDSTKKIGAMNEIDTENQNSNTKINDSNNHEDDDIVRKTILSIPIHSTSSTSEIYPSIRIFDCKPLISSIAASFSVNSGHENDHQKRIHHDSSMRLVETWIGSRIRQIQRRQPINDINDMPIDANTLGPLLFTLVPRKLDHSVVFQSPTTTSIPRSLSSSSASSSYFITGSGGYADYLFRSVALHVFNIADCPIDIWCPVAMTNDNIGAKNVLPPIESKSDALLPTAAPPARVRKMSARTARYSKQREYYEAVIYQNLATKQYYIPTTTTTATTMKSSDDNVNVHLDTIVLRFVIVYGMSTVQNVLTKLTAYSDVGNNENRKDKKKQRRIDYIECMACAQSCLNGNGQIRSTTMNMNGDKDVMQQREAPSDSRLRVQRTQHFYPINTYDNMVLLGTSTSEEEIVDTYTDPLSDRILPSSTSDSCRGDRGDSLILKNPKFYTRYHVVTPMQHTMGVSAGIAVQDTMW